MMRRLVLPVWVAFFFLAVSFEVRAMETDEDESTRASSSQGSSRVLGKRGPKEESGDSSGKRHHVGECSLARDKLSLSALDVANYFVDKDINRRERGEQGRSIDPLKLQKLCYYAQGYYLAIHGRPLFEEKIIKYHHGPYTAEVHEVYRGYSVISVVKGVVPDLLRQLAIVNLFLIHLDKIYAMFLPFTGKQLEYKTHQEPTWTIPKHKETISCEIMIDYFRDPARMAGYRRGDGSDLMEDSFKSILDNALSLTDGLDCFCRAIDRMREMITGKRSYEDVVAARDKLEIAVGERRDRILEVMMESPSFSEQFGRMQWSHQSVDQAVMGAVLYPDELRQMLDFPICLYGREDIRFKLAYAAGCKNPLAMAHFSKLLAVYNDDEVEQSQLGEKSKKFHDEAQKYFFDAQTNPDVHPFLRALSFLNVDQKDKAKAKECFEEAISRAEVNGLMNPEAYYHLGVLCEGEDAIRWYDLASESGYNVALINRAQRATTNEDAVELFLEAGKRGVAEGYYAVAKMLRAGDVPDQLKNEDPLPYLEEAGAMGALGAYDFAADIVIKRRDFEKAKWCYLRKGDQGSQKGYYDLARIYQNEGNKEKAIEYYKKAGPLLGVLEAWELEEKLDSPEERRRLEDEFSVKYDYHFDELVKIAEGKEEEIDAD